MIRHLKDFSMVLPTDFTHVPFILTLNIYSPTNIWIWGDQGNKKVPLTMQISNQEKQLLITLIWSQYRQDYYQIRNPCIILSAPFLSFLVFENNIFVASRSHIEIRDWFIMLILSWVTWSWLNSEHAKKLSYLVLFR